MLISKTTFLEFQMCPKNTWLKLHRPDLLQQFTLSEFELHLVNKWIGQLPGAWSGRWNNLELSGNWEYREPYLTQLRAVIGYLEVNRDQIKAGRRWRRLFAGRQEPAPIEAEFKEVAEVPEKPAKKTGKSGRLIKRRE